METNKTSKGRSWMGALKVGALGLIAALGMTVFAGTQTTTPVAQASPTGLVVLNSALCTALGTAFGGIPALGALADCNAFSTQDAFQKYTQCLLKQVVASDCPLAPGPAATGLVRPTPSTFKALDLDKNQVHLGQSLKVIAFVNDDFPVRFTTDVGHFVSLTPPKMSTQNYECKLGDVVSSQRGEGDPDCDGNPATVGDGVVVATLQMDDANFRGTGHINVEQENIVFPATFTVVGPPETITLTPLFGKDTISTGATPPTADDANALSTDCNFAATVDGVLGANNQAEKAVIVAKALDNDGNEVVGALLTWSHQYGKFDGLTAKALGPTRQAGVALPQTPTLDTGALGIGFPQFVCGIDEPGDFTVDVTFDGKLDPISTQDPGLSAHKSITIHVIKPAANIALAADPPSLDCNGTNTSKVTASVTNADGQPVANGLDVNYSVVALGTANPLTVNSTAGAASSVIAPLAGASTLTTDGGPQGVTVTVTVAGARTQDILKTPFDKNSPFKKFEETGTLYNLGSQTVVQKSILVQCTGGPLVGAPPAPAPANAGGAAGAAGRPTGTISGPDTGSGGFGTSNDIGWAPVAGLAVAALMLAAVSFAARRPE